VTQPPHSSHAISETPLVQQALDRLRARLGSQQLDIAELVVLGAEEKVRRLQRDTTAVREAREWLAREILEGLHDPETVRLADEVKYLGLIPNY
jgi:hypothetical protein